MYNYINKRLYILIYFIRGNNFNKPLIRVYVLHQGAKFPGFTPGKHNTITPRKSITFNYLFIHLKRTPYIIVSSESLHLQAIKFFSKTTHSAPFNRFV